MKLKSLMIIVEEIDVITNELNKLLKSLASKK